MTDIPQSPLPIERSLYVANTISGILYGVFVYMVVQSYQLLKDAKRETAGRRTFFIIYGFVQLLLVTVEFSLNTLTGELMWIDHRNSPGGPLAYFISIGSSGLRICVIVCAVVSMAMADGLLLYRCYVIWNSNIRVILFPLFLYVAELATGIAVPIEVALTHSTFLSTRPVNFSIPWVSLGCSLTALLTSLIVGRIIYISRGVELYTNYNRIVCILVEAALPLSLAGIAFAVCVGQNFYPKVPFAHIWGMLVAIAPQSIILRVAMGHAWTENAFNQSTNNIEFARGNNITQKSQEYSTPDVFRVKLEDGPKETV